MKPPGKLSESLAALRALLPQCMQRDRARLEVRLRQVQRGAAAAELDRLLRAARASARQRARRQHSVPVVRYPPELPISAHVAAIRQAIQEHPVVIVAGETGSGKTTQLPKICLEAGRGTAGMIACTQPRRVAALSLSARIAAELQVPWGRQVGCKIRFTDETAPDTLIKLVTDGMLLAEIQGDRHLDAYDTIIVDEAHERSLNVDYLLGYLQVLLRRRRDLRVIVTSATIDTAAFARAFGGAPVIQVSGRLFPVEVRYWPVEQVLGEAAEGGYTAAAAAAVQELYAEFPREGDLLVFMPTEADVRETCDLLAACRLPATEILPLFGRLTRAEQERVFAPAASRRIVVATNIAETSLTIPRIRFVVDTGLARISRFNPRTRTQRLPIEPVSRSSADQRAGRCGRVAAGVCVRLYSEQDYLARPLYTEPEIRRTDLAHVILHMKAHQLGQIETFPFIDPPAAAAIRGGYELLQELNALDEERRLTGLGRTMARLPVAPTDARMLVQANAEGALREVLVIAAALGIQDPRERPLDQQAAADQMHRQFADPQSDFLGLLNIWNAYHDKLDELGTQGRMRRFCREHFLSYARMREWRDIHGQLQRLVLEEAGFALNETPASAAAIHRAVLSGLLGNVAQQQDGNVYRAARGRQVMIFPGSGLFARRPPRAPAGRPAAAAGSAPPWIMAAEIVETSRLFARTVARIEPEWLVELGAHLCRSSYKDPRWDAASGRVLVQETLTLYGLAVLVRRVPYGRIAPAEATEIFIREALVPGDPCLAHAFVRHNVRLLDKLATWQARTRGTAPIDLEEAAADFYRQRLPGVSSVHDLNRVLRRHAGEPGFLTMQPADLLGPAAAHFAAEAFPDALHLDGEELPLEYAYRPGDERDGVTVRVPYTLAHAIRPEILDWLVPGLLQEKVTALLRSLPKAMRRELVPIPERAASIAAALRPTHPSFLESLEAHLWRQYRLRVGREDWRLEQLPEHLRMRVEVTGTDRTTIASGRDLAALRARLDRHESEAELEAWNRAVREYEREGLTGWTIGDQPVRVQVTQVGGVPLYGYPGLESRADGVRLHLFRSEEEARQASRQGLLRLCELVLQEPLAWLERELRQLEQYRLLCSGLVPVAELRRQAMAHLEEHLFLREPLHPLTEAGFARLQSRAEAELRGLGPQFVAVVGRVLAARQQLAGARQAYPDLTADLARLAPPDFLRITPYRQLAHLERYLQAAWRRAERYRLDPAKDAQLAARIGPYAARLEQWRAAAPPPSAPRQAAIEAFRWMLEEYRVSVFAQELGTAYPVSPKRLDRQLAAIEATA